eukprot:6073263-Prymnesium_polylepis.1
MDGAPSGQAEEFPLTSVRKSFWSASGMNRTEDLCLHRSSRPCYPLRHCSDLMAEKPVGDRFNAPGAA